MNTSLIAGNLATYFLQIGLLVALAACVPFLLRLRMPGSRLIYLQCVLAACLLLPTVRSWKQDAIGGTVDVSTSVTAFRPSSPAPHFNFSFTEIALFLLAAGALARLAWLVTGFWRLRRYRLNSRPLDRPSPWSAEADLLIADEIASPVTFGFLHPVVLLPARFPDLEGPMREAILCHEVIHVRRHDWLFTVAEEVIRTALWFHPAIWWLLGEIQLAREQAVDREVIETLKIRDEYVDALLAIAGGPQQFDLAPAPLFLRRRHLKQRVVSILKEVRMSRTRSISALAAGLGMLAVSCWFVTGALPLSAAPQTVNDAAGVAVEINGAQLMHRQPVDYPRDAMAKGIQGTVVAQVKLDAGGNVSDATILSGPEELRKAVLQSLLNWHFTKDSAFRSREVSITFAAPRNGSTMPVPQRAQEAIASPAIQPTRTIKSITISGLSDETRAQLLAQLPVHDGDEATSETQARILQTVRAFDEHLGSVFRPISPAEVAVTIAPVPPPPAPPPLPAVQSAGPTIRVGGNIQQNNLIQKVTPVYPPLAKQARIQGMVRFEASIGKDGHIQNLQLVSGPPLLAPAAMEAVQDWVYRPTLLNGEPVDVITTIDVNFTLSQ